MLGPKGNMMNCLVVFGVLGAVTNFPEGYSNSYPNTSYKSWEKMINGSYVKRGDKDGLSDSAYTWVWSAMLNVWFLGYLLGTFVTPYFTEKYGRKMTLLIANGIGLIGSVLSLLSVLLSIPELFFVSRIVASTSSGISFGALILFIQETTPTEYRGMTSFLSETTFVATTVLGIGFGMDAVFGKNLPALTGVSIIPAVISIIIMIPLKETPKFLLLKRNDREAALDSLKYYQGTKYENEKILDEMLLEMCSEEESNESVLQGVLTVLKEPHLRTPFFIGCLSLQVVVGVWPIVYLSTDLLEKNFDEETSQLASLAFIMANFLAGLGGMFIIERLGRRTLVLYLGVASTFALALYVTFEVLTTVYQPLRWGSIVALILFGMCYGVGLGPIAFFITSELVAQRYRSLVQSMVFATNTLANFTLSFATLPAYSIMQAWCFVPLFIIPSIFSLVYLYLYMPETIGREVHDVVDELLRRQAKVRSLTILNGSMSGLFTVSMDSEKDSTISRSEIKNYMSC